MGGVCSLVIMPTLAGGGVDPRVARCWRSSLAATDALCIVVTMVLIDLLTSDAVELSRPSVTLGREVGLGAGSGS